MMKTCPSCLLEKPISEFSKNNSYQDGHNVYCRKCQKEKSKEYYLNNKKKISERAINYYKKRRDETRSWLISYLKTHPCVDCGESDIVVLQFDHPIGQKNFSLGDSLGRISLKKFKKEAEKCEVVCANCHTKRTAKLQDWWKLDFS